MGKVAGWICVLATATAATAPTAGAAIGKNGLIAYEAQTTVNTIDPTPVDVLSASLGPVLPIPIPNLPTNSANVAWSPNAKMLAFSRTVSGVPNIWVVNADGTGLDQITRDPVAAIDPTWSPDDRIAFTSYGGGARDIYITDINKAPPVRLTTDGLSQQAAWSPDGDRIAFESDRSGNRDIWVMAFDGTPPQQLTTALAEDADVDWSPDATRLAFSSGTPVIRAIYSISTSGTDPMRLTDDRLAISFPAWSPDGKQIAFAENNIVKRIPSDALSTPQTTTTVVSPGTDPAWARFPEEAVAVASPEVKVTNPDGTKRAEDGPLPEGTKVDATDGVVTVNFRRPAVAAGTLPATAEVEGATFTVAAVTPDVVTLRGVSPAPCPAGGVTAARARGGKEKSRYKVRSGRKRGRYNVRTDRIDGGDDQTSYRIVESCRGTWIKVTFGVLAVRARSCTPGGRCTTRGTARLVRAGQTIFMLAPTG